MTDFTNLGENDLLEFDGLFCDFVPDNLDSLDVDRSSSGVNSDHNSCGSDGVASFSIVEIENFLLNDDFQPLTDRDADAFLSDFLVDSPPTIATGSDTSASPSPSPDVEYSNDKDCSPSDLDEKGGNQLHQQVENNNVQNDNDNDPLAKKRKRQMRNRDAAVRSRERKKIYVKDLEMKSRYYEAECRKLEWMLQCARAENHALQIALHTNHQAFGASKTKQESAVLLLESLLLGSLLWFMGIIGLVILLLPRQLLLVILGAALLENAEEENQRSLICRKMGSNIFGMSGFRSFMKSKRWRGSRTRMKRTCRCLMLICLL